MVNSSGPVWARNLQVLQCPCVGPQFTGVTVPLCGPAIYRCYSAPVSARNLQVLQFQQNN